MATEHPTAAAADPPAQLLRFPDQLQTDNRAVAAQFGKNLANERRAAGVSQEELGYRASLHRTEISLLERGCRIPRIDTVVKVAGGLDISVEALLSGIGWQSGTVRTGQFVAGRRG